MEILKDKLCAFFKYKLDGSKFYIGKSMTEVHKNLGISDELFDKMTAIFLDSLRKKEHKIKPSVIRNFYKKVITLRSEICHPPMLIQPLVE